MTLDDLKKLNGR